MVKNEKTSDSLSSSKDGTDPESHQDYSNWVITGRRVYQTSPQHSEYNGEYEEVISVEGSPIVCLDCNSTDKPCWKPTMNTPSFHASPEGMCSDCMLTWVTKENIQVVPDSELYEEFWLMTGELGHTADVMNEAEVYPDNLSTAKGYWLTCSVEHRKEWFRDTECPLVEDIAIISFDSIPETVREAVMDEYEEYYEEGDPVTWDQFSKESQIKIVDSIGSSSNMFERLHGNGYHKFCRRDPDNDSVDEEEHVY